MPALARRLRLRDFRNYDRAELELGDGLTVVVGANGAGKTNLLEGLYFSLTGRSCRTSAEREVVRAGASATRVSIDTLGADGAAHRLDVGFAPGEPKLLELDGAAVERTPDPTVRPLANVFMPDRLALVKGAPSARRGHLDQLAGALRPVEATVRASYSQALTQRNAALARIRAGRSTPASLDPWDTELARHGFELMRLRAETTGALVDGFSRHAAALGLPEPATLRYAPRSRAETAAELGEELLQRRPADLERGFTGHGPHRDDVVLRHGDRLLRAYGSQGQQRVGLLALLFAERDLLLEQGAAPIMLLDDVTSELDLVRRRRLSELVRAGGQVVVSATELGHVPGATDDDVVRVEVEAGRLSPEAEPHLAAA
jgi:DNA replication and repair protein RecF